MRGHTFTTLDLFETQAVIDALDDQIKWLEVRMDRLPKTQRLEFSYFVARKKALRDRLNKRFAPAYAKLMQPYRESADAR